MWFVKQQLASTSMTSRNRQHFQVSSIQKSSSVPPSAGSHGCFCSFAGRGGPRFHHCQSCHASRDWRSRGSPKRLALGATKRLVKSIQYRNSISDATRSILLCCTLSKLIVESDRVIIIHFFEWPKGNHSWVGCKLNPFCACIVSPCCT